MVKPIKLDELPLATSVDAADELVIAKPSGALERVTAETVAAMAAGSMSFSARNLLIGSNVRLTSEKYTIGSYKLPKALTEGEQYTVSFAYRCSENTPGLNIYYNGKQNVAWQKDKSKTLTVASHTFTVRPDSAVSDNYLSFYQGASDKTDASGSEVLWAVLTKGNVPVNSWFPAPEDLGFTVGGGKYLCFSGYAMEGRAA